MSAAATSTADGAVAGLIAFMGLGLAALVVLAVMAVVAVVTEARRTAEYLWIARERRARWEAREEERLRAAEYVLVPWRADES
jgi:hypothetical protein